MKKQRGLYLWLARINLFISSFTFGGGYVVVPMVKKYYVQQRRLFTEEELMEMAAIAQSTPGAIAINLVALAGYRVGGALGALISCLCAIIPPIVILSLVSAFYTAFISNALVAAMLKGMQGAVAALIVDFVVDMSKAILKERSILLNALAVLSFAICFFTSINVIFVLMGSSAICALRILIRRKACV